MYYEKFLSTEVQNKALELGGREIDAKGSNSQQKEGESYSMMQTQSEVLVQTFCLITVYVLQRTLPQETVLNIEYVCEYNQMQR